MKRLFNGLTIVFLAVLFTSCGGEEVPVADDSVELSVSPTSQVVDALGEQKRFTVISASDWYARSSAKWIKVLTVSGKASSTGVMLNIIVEENKAMESRSGEITVGNINKESVSIRIEQAASDGQDFERGIADADDLVGFAKAVNGEGSIARYMVDGVVKFIADIDASSIREWTPAGTEELPLTYSIDGGNHIIKNVNWAVDVEKNPLVGLIGYAKGITIENLTFGTGGSQVNLTGSVTENVYGGGIIGKGENVVVRKVTNYASQIFSGSVASGKDLVLGGIVGITDQSCVVGGDMTAQGCVNRGNIEVSALAKEGGIVGYNCGTIRNCINYGTISGPAEGDMGPGWLCSHNESKSSVTSNFGYGYVGSTPALMKNSMVNYEEGYDIEANTVDWTVNEYYDWEEVQTRQLHSGAVYRHYDCINVPRQIHVLEIDLTDPGIEILGSYAGEMCPNPNGNGNHNNGFKLRETLSMLCERRRSEGQNILAGTNGGFFDSHDGISRGFHVEDCEPVYVNNPAVVQGLPAQAYALTVFTDGTASIGKKTFTGKVRMGGEEYNYYTLNDTTLRHTAPDKTPINLYNWRYVRVPYPEASHIINDLADDALYVICEYTSSPMTVNTGYSSARIVEIRDGRKSIIELPYVTARNQIIIALSGEPAAEWAGKIKVGDTVDFMCEIAIDGDASKPIFTQVSSKYQYMVDGQDNESAKLDSDVYNPITFTVVSQNRTKVWVVTVDGRQEWYSTGIKGYELYRIAKKLGGWWATRLDGGGSSTMWVWDAAQSKGSVVNSLSGAVRGERSCLNYVLIRAK